VSAAPRVSSKTTVVIPEPVEGRNPGSILISVPAIQDQHGLLAPSMALALRAAFSFAVLQTLSGAPLRGVRNDAEVHANINK
jgi:hypothetical protein